jgi:hypothetical protein
MGVGLGMVMEEVMVWRVAGRCMRGSKRDPGQPGG